MVKSEKLIENAMGKYILRKLIKIIEANGQINTHITKKKNTEITNGKAKATN